jgi:PAS domain S-box-containing protein
MHRILERQLKRYRESGGALPDGSESFLQEISNAYTHFDEDHALIDRSLDLSSKELGQINQRLREESDRAKAIVSSMGEGLIVVDENRLIISVNSAAAQLLKTSVADMIGKTTEEVAQLYKGETELPVSERPAAHTLKSGESSAWALDDGIFIQSKSGHRFPAAITTTPLIRNNAPSGVVIIFRDITQEKEATEYIESQVVARTKEVQEARVRLVASINSLELGFVITEGTDAINILNSAAARVLLLPEKSDMYSLSDICDSFQDNIDLRQAIEQCVGSQQSAEFGCVVLKDRFIHLYLSPISLEGTPIGCAIVIEDITEAKVMERSKDEFFSIASHELRTPLTAIRGFTEILHETYSPSLNDPHFDHIIDNIDKGSKRLIAVVNDFLNMSGLEQGKISFNMAPTDLGSVVYNEVQELQKVALNSNLTLSVAWPDWPLPLVRTDQDRLKQVLVNLVGNAIKFSPAGGVTISFEGQDGFIEVKVTDTGKGISPQSQHLLFHKFQQAGENLLTRDASNGTGLGLYISKLIVEGMGGKIYIKQSQPGVGTTFAFTLPTA